MNEPLDIILKSVRKVWRACYQCAYGSYFVYHRLVQMGVSF